MATYLEADRAIHTSASLEASVRQDLTWVVGVCSSRDSPQYQYVR